MPSVQYTIQGRSSSLLLHVQKILNRSKVNVATCYKAVGFVQILNRITSVALTINKFCFLDGCMFIRVSRQCTSLRDLPLDWELDFPFDPRRFGTSHCPGGPGGPGGPAGPAGPAGPSGPVAPSAPSVPLVPGTPGKPSMPSRPGSPGRPCGAHGSNTNFEKLLNLTLRQYS